MTNAHARKKQTRAAVAAVALVPGDGDAPARVLSGGADARADALGQGAPAARAARAGVARDVPGRAGAEAGGRGHAGRVRRGCGAGPSGGRRAGRRVGGGWKKKRKRVRVVVVFFKRSSKVRAAALPGPPRPRTPPSTRSPGACPCGRAPTSPAAKPGVPGPAKETKRKTRLGFRRRARSPVLGVRQRKRRRDRNGKKTRLARNSAQWTARAWPAIDVRATADGARTCSNPTCVAREDAMAPGRKIAPVLALQASDVLLDALPAHALARRAQTRYASRRRATRVVPRTRRPRRTRRSRIAPRRAPRRSPRGAKRLSRPRRARRRRRLARRALVVESESDESDESDASDLEAEADVVARAAATSARGKWARRPGRGLILGAERDGRRLGRRGAGASRGRG